MKINLEKMEKDEATFEITVDQDEVERGLEATYKRLVKRVNVPGFRRGKAPRHILERYVGREAFRQEALEDLFPKVYDEAIRELKIEPIAQPNIESVKMEVGEPLVLRVAVAVAPEAELGDYRSLRVEGETVQVTPERIDQELEHLREHHAHLVVESPETEVSKGHFVVLDYKGFLDGQEFPGGSAEGQLLEIGSGSFVPGFEDQLLGMRAGEEREIKVTFPEDYQARDLAGREATFQVKIQEIKRRVFPELDDDFARLVGGYASLQELREDIANRVREAETARVRKELEKKVLDAVVEVSKVDPPAILVEQKIDRVLAELEERLSEQKLTLSDYLKLAGKDLQTLREGFREAAEKSVRRDLVLKSVAKKEGLTVAEEEVDRYLAGLAEAYRQPVESVLKIFSQGQARDRVKEELLLGKTVDFLVDLIGVTKENVGESPTEAPPAEVPVGEKEGVEER